MVTLQEHYRALPIGVRLIDVRRKLAMQGTWPKFLRQDHHHNGAVAAPFKLWQAAVFQYFIFGPRNLRATFALHQVTNWVRGWFGESADLGQCLDDAVIAFLAALTHLGFLQLSANVGSGAVYRVLHADLSLPVKAGARWTGGERSGFIAPSSGSTVEWSAAWPEYDSVRRSVTKWISMSQKDELILLNMLFKHRENLPTPMEFALHMCEKIPSSVVFNFLRSHGFVT